MEFRIIKGGKKPETPRPPKAKEATHRKGDPDKGLEDLDGWPMHEEEMRLSPDWREA